MPYGVGAVCPAMLSVQPSTKTSDASASHSANLPQDSKVPALNLSVLSRAVPPIPSARTSVTARAPQKLSPTTPRAKVPQSARDPPTPDVHHQLSSLRPPALVSSARLAHASEQSFRPSFSRIDERIDMRPFSEAGTSMIGSEELGRVQASLLKHVPVGGHRHYNHVAEETSQRFTDFADLMARRTQFKPTTARKITELFDEKRAEEEAEAAARLKKRVHVFHPQELPKHNTKESFESKSQAMAAILKSSETSRLDTIAHVSLGIRAFAEMGPEWKFAAYKGGALASMMGAVSRLIDTASSKQECSDLAEAWNAVASICQTDNAALLFWQHGGIDIACQSISHPNCFLSVAAATACSCVLKQMPVRLGQPFGDSVFLKLLDAAVSARCEAGCVAALTAVHGMLLRLQEANALRLQPWHVKAFILVIKARVQSPASKLTYPTHRRSLATQLGISFEVSKKRPTEHDAPQAAPPAHGDLWIWPASQEILLKILMMLTLLGDEVGVDMIGQGVVAALGCWWGGSMDIFEQLKHVAVASEQKAATARPTSAVIAGLLSPKPKTPNPKLKRLDTSVSTPWARGDAWVGLEMADWLLLPYFGHFDTGTVLEDHQVMDDPDTLTRLLPVQPRIHVQSPDDFNPKALAVYAQTSAALVQSLQESLTSMNAEQRQLLEGNCILNDGGLELQLMEFDSPKDDVLKNILQGLDVLYELLLQRQHPNDAWIWGQLQPLNLTVRIMERTLKDGAGAISSTGMFIYQADNKVFKKALRLLNTVLSVQCIHPCVRIRSCKFAANVGAIGVLQRALQFAPKVFHSLALTALSSILSIAPIAQRFYDLGGSFLIMADELQRVMDASNKTDEISKFDRLLRLLPLCGALARHPQNVEMIFAGGKCSLVSAILKVIGFALSPADCRSMSEASADMKGCSSLQDELHALADAHPNSTMMLRKLSVAQRACEILGDLAAACAVLPHDASFFLMQSMGHSFSAELAANHSARKPASSDSAASRASLITCDPTVSGFCLIVLRVLCPLLTSAATFAPHISLKLLLAAVATAEFASLSVSAGEPDLASSMSPTLAAATLGAPNSWSCSAVASAWQRRAAILDCLFIRRPDLHASYLARGAAPSLEKVPEHLPGGGSSPPEQRPAALEALPKQAVAELQSPSHGGAANASSV